MDTEARKGYEKRIADNERNKWIFVVESNKYNGSGKIIEKNARMYKEGTEQAKRILELMNDSVVNIDSKGNEMTIQDTMKRIRGNSDLDILKTVKANENITLFNDPFKYADKLAKIEADKLAKETKA